MEVFTNTPGAASGSRIGRAPLQGIGGWLLVVAFGQVATLLRALANFVQYYSNFQLRVVFVFAPMTVVAELVLNVAYIFLIGFGVYAFFATKRYFRRLFVLEVVASPLLIILDACLVGGTLGRDWTSLLDANFGRSIGASIAASVWIIYLYRSKRVANTFVS